MDDFGNECYDWHWYMSTETNGFQCSYATYGSFGWHNWSFDIEV